MAIGKLVEVGGVDTPTNTRTRKADRGFSPPALGLRPSKLRVAEGVLAHIKASGRDFKQERVYASQLKNCIRQQAMGIMGFPKHETGENYPQWAAVADLGTWLHDKVEGWLKAIGGTVTAEFDVVDAEFGVRSPDDTLGGRVDAHLADVVVKVEGDRGRKRKWAGREDYQASIEVQGEQYILDAKTVGEKDYKEGAWGRKVQGYIGQISVYGHLTGAKKGIILLVNRNTGEMMDLEFDIDPDYAEAMLQRAAYIVQTANARELPAAEEWTPSGPSFFCRNCCPFFRICAEQQETGAIQRRLRRGDNPADL